MRTLQSVSGPFDLIAEIVAPSVAEMDALIDALGALPGVERTTSSIVLSTKIVPSTPLVGRSIATDLHSRQFTSARKAGPAAPSPS